MPPLLDGLAPGSVRFLPCRDTRAYLSACEALWPPAEHGPLVVSLSLSDAVGVEALLDEAVAALAELAGRLFPNWYGLRLADADELSGKLSAVVEAAVTPAARAPVSLAWLRRAAARCVADEKPIWPGPSRTVHAAQLARALAASPPALVLACTAPPASEAHALGIVRAAEWLATVAGSRVLVLGPPELAGQPAFAPILYTPPQTAPAPVHEAAPASPAGAPDPARGAAEQRFRVFPIVGQPHPYSPGEQALAAALARDPELGPLFGFNQPVRTVDGARYLVDLLWPAGGLVVEVDGYAFHGTPDAFAADRQRDYALLASGYLVLRLTHGEVMADADRAVDKIRKLARRWRADYFKS